MTTASLLGNRTVDERELLLVIADRANALLAHRIILPDRASNEAWELLKEGLANYQSWQLHGNESSKLPVHTKPCQYCGCEIFFAASNAGDNHWRPFELDPVDAHEVTPSWRYVINFSALGSRRGYPIFKTSPSKQSGHVYICHLHSCGIHDSPKFSCAPYVRRWKVNVERADLLAQTAEAELRALSRRLAPHNADGA